MGGSGALGLQGGVLSVSPERLTFRSFFLGLRVRRELPVSAITDLTYREHRPWFLTSIASGFFLGSFLFLLNSPAPPTEVAFGIALIATGALLGVVSMLLYRPGLVVRAGRRRIRMRASPAQAEAAMRLIRDQQVASMTAPAPWEPGAPDGPTTKPYSAR